MQSNVDAIVQLFPDFEQKINFLLQYDENFRDLCTDYILCSAMVLVRKKGTQIINEELAEFEVLQHDLLLEIDKEISEFNLST